MLAKIGRENRFPRDPHMLGLLSWKQEQVEGVAIVTIVVENILKELDIDQSKVALLKVTSNSTHFMRYQPNFACRLGCVAA